MKEFPAILKVTNKEKFNEFNKNRTLAYLRRELYEHMIREVSIDENKYFDLDKFCEEFKTTKEQIKELVDTVMKELRDLGWNCKLSFADTGLFVYSSEKPPSSCWNGDFNE